MNDEQYGYECADCNYHYINIEELSIEGTCDLCGCNDFKTLD